MAAWGMSSWAIPAWCAAGQRCRRDAGTAVRPRCNTQPSDAGPAPRQNHDGHDPGEGRFHGQHAVTAHPSPASEAGPALPGAGPPSSDRRIPLGIALRRPARGDQFTAARIGTLCTLARWRPSAGVGSRSSSIAYPLRLAELGCRPGPAPAARGHGRGHRTPRVPRLADPPSTASTRSPSTAQRSACSAACTRFDT